MVSYIIMAMLLAVAIYCRIRLNEAHKLNMAIMDDFVSLLMFVEDWKKEAETMKNASV